MHICITIWLSLLTMRHLVTAEEVMEAIGENDNAIVRKLARDYGIDTTQPTMNRWRRGREPEGFPVIIALLDMAGMLNTAGGQRSNDAMAAHPTDPLERLAAGQEEIALTLKDVLARLPEPAEVPVAQRRAAPKRRAK